MKKIELESLREKLNKRKNKIGLVGTILNVSETRGDSISASISNDWKEIDITYGSELDLIPDSETQTFAWKTQISNPNEKIGEDLVEHETGHRENTAGTKFGCPYTAEMHDLIKESIFLALKEKGKTDLENYVTNSFEDILDNVNCRNSTNFSGMTLFWNNQGLTRSQNRIFSPFYEAFVRINLMLGGEVKSHTLLKRFFKDSPEIKQAYQGFLGELKTKLGLESTLKLHEKPEFQRLFTTDISAREKLWTELAYSFAFHTADLLENIPNEKMFGSPEDADENSDKSNPFDIEIKNPQVAQKIVRKRYEQKKGLAQHREAKEQLYELYRAISKDIQVQVSTYTESQLMPLVYFGKRAFNPEKDRKLRFKGIQINPDGTFGIRTSKHSIDFPVAHKTHPRNCPKLKITLMDGSGSMLESPAGDSDVGDTSSIPWGDKSKYHFALKGKFGIDNYLERQGIANYVNDVALGWSGETPLRADYKTIAKSLLTKPSGGTSFDINGLEKELDSHSLVLSISDGACSFDDEIAQRLKKKLQECDFAHIQIGGETEFSEYLEKLNIPVFYVRGDEDLSKIMINFVSGYYRQKQTPTKLRIT